MLRKVFFVLIRKLEFKSILIFEVDRWSQDEQRSLTLGSDVTVLLGGEGWGGELTCFEADLFWGNMAGFVGVLHFSLLNLYGAILESVSLFLQRRQLVLEHFTWFSCCY